ncbi:MAG: DUF2207 domain-containing protein [Eggerthellaceae bacterium]|nr:DUF2207 domain-containing protein [Eggerthellaceae bacterium]
MQTISHQQKNGITKAGIPWLTCLAVGIFATLVCLAIQPVPAFAKSYTMPKVDIAATVGTDGSLNVVEQRTFDFSGDFTAVWWTFSGLPANASLKVNAVSLTTASGQTEQLSSVPFVLSWRDAGGPGKDAYSVDTPLDTAYVFFEASDEELTVTFDYTIVNGVQAYQDVADLYWKYISDQWQENSQNVTMTLTLPVPAGVTVTPGDNVRAWGHGPLDGTLAFNADGTISYKVNNVNSGQYAEARVVFNTSWLTNLDKTAQIHLDEPQLNSILAEEQYWADQANHQRMLALIFIIVCGVICLLALLWALLMYFKYGKEHKPEFTETYWRDVPSPTDHPVTMARLWRWEKPSPDDLTATMMHLSHIGAIRIDKGNYEKPGAFGSQKQVDDYYMTLVPEVSETLTDPIDIEAIKLLFGQIAEGADSLWFGSIELYGKKHAQEMVDGMDAWQGIVQAEINKRGFFELKGSIRQKEALGIGTLMIIASVVACIIADNFIPLIFAIPDIAAIFFISSKMRRRSQEGATLYAKCKALAQWLKDFSLLDERPPTDVKVWGELMVYAYIFGVAKEAIEALQLKVPEVFQDGDPMRTGIMPWWFWYRPMYGASGNTVPSVGDAFHSAFSNTVATAQAAVSAAASASGHGGGFGGGGGGGMGGGGGAR